MPSAAPNLQSMHLHGGETANVLRTAVAQKGIDDEAFDLGIVRLSAQREVLYSNRAAKAIMGRSAEVGMKIADMPLDDESRERVATAMSQRFESERGTSYPIRFWRDDLGTWVRILISAVPEYDAGGECIGSIGYIIDKTVDAAVLDIHQVIAEARDCHELLSGVAQHLHDVLSFDTLGVVGISEERNHLVQIFEDPPPPAFISPTKWWPMPKFVKCMIEGCETGPLNLTDMYASREFREYAKEEPDAQRFVERGFLHCLRMGVYREQKLVAMLSLLRKADQPFADKDHERLLKLPLNEAVLAAMDFAQRNEMEFSAGFVQQIARVANNTEAVSQLLVDELARHYLWTHVSLFRLEEDEAAFRLVCEAATNQKKLPPGYCQPNTTGFLGEAYRYGKTVNVGDVTQDKWAGRYHALLENTRSEMVLPVPGTDGRWLLNVESDMRWAFANAEQKSVEIQLQIAGFTLERTASLELKTAIFNSVADVVIRTNDLFVVVEANPATERLLGYEPGALVNRRLSDLLHFDCQSPDADGLEAEEFCSRDRATVALTRIVDQDEPEKVKLKRADGQLVPVLLSAAPLPDRFGGRIFVAGDLSEQERNQRMEVLRNVFHQLASEIRLPLALGEAFLEEAVEQTGDEARELIDKTLRQIRKADMPLERMVRIAVRDQGHPLPRTNFDLREAMKRMVDEFPEHEAKDIEFHAQDDIVPVQAARHELLFCVRSLLAYLMRRKAQVEAVDIRVESTGPDAVIALALGHKTGGSEREETPEELAAEFSDSDMELTLAEPVIENLMKRMGGEYVPAAPGRWQFQLRFHAR